MILAVFCEVVHEKLWNYVNICKSYGEKNSGTFYVDTVNIKLLFIKHILSAFLFNSVSFMYRSWHVI